MQSDAQTKEQKEAQREADLLVVLVDYGQLLERQNGKPVLELRSRAEAVLQGLPSKLTAYELRGALKVLNRNIHFFPSTAEICNAIRQIRDLAKEREIEEQKATMHKLPEPVKPSHACPLCIVVAKRLERWIKGSVNTDGMTIWEASVLGAAPTPAEAECFATMGKSATGTPYENTFGNTLPK